MRDTPLPEYSPQGLDSLLRAQLKAFREKEGALNNLANTKEFSLEAGFRVLDTRGTGVLYADEILEGLFSLFNGKISMKGLALFLSRNIGPNETYTLEEFSRNFTPIECGSQELLHNKQSSALPLSIDSQALVKKAWEAQMEYELKSNEARETCCKESEENIRRVLLEFATSMEADICVGMMKNEN